jgi:hypothetical protein
MNPLENIYRLKHKHFLFIQKYYKVSELYENRYMEYQFQEALRKSRSIKEIVKDICKDICKDMFKKEPSIL